MVESVGTLVCWKQDEPQSMNGDVAPEEEQAAVAAGMAGTAGKCCCEDHSESSAAAAEYTEVARWGL